MKKSRKIFRNLLLFFFSLLFVALFYVIAIMIEPEDNIDLTSSGENSFYLPQEAISPKEPEHIDSFDQLSQLADQFPAPLLFLQEGDDVTFISADLYDLHYEHSYARVLRLAYGVESLPPVYLYCIYPKEALSLLEKKGMTLTTKEEYLNAFPAVRMEGSEQARLHAQSNLALYALTVPGELKDRLSFLGSQTILLPQNVSLPGSPAQESQPEPELQPASELPSEQIPVSDP